MRRDVMMFGAGVIAAAMLPIGMAVLEATTGPTQDKAAATTRKTVRPKKPLTTRQIAEVKFDTTISETPDLSDIVLGGGTPRTEAHSEVPAVEPESTGLVHVEFYGGANTTTADNVVVLTPSMEADQAESVIPQAVVGDLLSANEDMVAAVMPGEIVAVNNADTEELQSTVGEPGSTVLVIDRPASDTASSPMATAASPAVTSTASGPSSNNVGDVSDVTAHPGEATATVAAGGYDRERVSLTLLRPKDLKVIRQDQVLARVQKKGDWHAFLLVRSRQKGAEWWVQPDPIRQGTYFRSRGLFGSERSPEGSMFVMAIAFVDNIADVPETGTVLKDIPPHVTLSEEFIVTLDRGGK